MSVLGTEKLTTSLKHLKDCGNIFCRLRDQLRRVRSHNHRAQKKCTGIFFKRMNSPMLRTPRRQHQVRLTQSTSRRRHLRQMAGPGLTVSNWKDLQTTISSLIP